MPWRRGCCCRWSSGAAAGSPRRAAALVGAGGRHGRRCQRGGHVRRAARSGALWLLTRDARSAAALADALVAGLHRCSARCGGWCRCSCWAPTARRSWTSSRRRPSRRSRPRSSTRCAAPRTGSRTSTCGPRRATTCIRQSYLRAQQRRRAAARARRAAAPRATRTACSSALVAARRAAAGHRGSRGRGAGLVRRAAARPCSTAPLAPLRNVHKFDPVIRLPLVLGLACAVRRGCARPGRARARTVRGTGRGRRCCVAVNQVVLVGVARGRRRWAPRCRRWPAGSRPPDTSSSVPGYWKQAADWLDEHGPADSRAARARVRRSATTCGARRDDEPLQSLARRRGRCATPSRWRPPGNIRMLDAIEERLAQGEGSAGPAPPTCGAPGSATSSSATTWLGPRRARPGAGPPGARGLARAVPGGQVRARVGGDASLGGAGGGARQRGLADDLPRRTGVVAMRARMCEPASQVE